MKRIVLILAIIFLSENLLFSQTHEEQMIYKRAFDELMQMIKGERKYDYKRAVFVAENTWYGGTLSYQKYCAEIDNICNGLRKKIEERNLYNYKTAGNWAVYHYMFEPNNVNNNEIMRYNYDDFLGRKDWSSTFVTKLMKTKKGNCHSMPMFFKLLCEELGYSAYLATAPLHMYAKHKDESGKWINVETTTGGFSPDSHIMKTFNVSAEQIKSGIYMTPLNNNETISLCIVDLIRNYIKKYREDIFVLSMIESTLAYVPDNYSLLLIKIDCYAQMLDNGIKNKIDKATLKKWDNIYMQTDAKLKSLHYEQVDEKWYSDLIKSITTTRKELDDKGTQERIDYYKSVNNIK